VLLVLLVLELQPLGQVLQSGLVLQEPGHQRQQLAAAEVRQEQELLQGLPRLLGSRGKSFRVKLMLAWKRHSIELAETLGHWQKPGIL
jgi:hypothetical protein